MNSIAEQITTNALAELGVIDKKKIEIANRTPNKAAVEAEERSAEIWAKWMGANLRKTGKPHPEHPVTSRHLVPVTENRWSQDVVLADMDAIRKTKIDMSGAGNAVMSTKDFKDMVEVMSSDMLNVAEQAGFIVTSSNAFNQLQVKIAGWLLEHTKQYDGTNYRVFVVEGP
tara:strand:- start:25947 stop:26459 length:513 start_codon:yes stop_codon:yes gene_type:complete